jgi:hypothetical protein
VEQVGVAVSGVISRLLYIVLRGGLSDFLCICIASIAWVRRRSYKHNLHFRGGKAHS